MIGNSTVGQLNNAELSKRYGRGANPDPKIAKYAPNFYRFNGTYENNTEYVSIQRGETRTAGGFEVDHIEAFLSDFIMENITLDDKHNVYKWETKASVKAISADPVVHEGEIGNTLELDYTSDEGKTTRFRAFYIRSKDAVSQGIRGAEVDAEYMKEFALNTTRSKGQVLRAVILAQATQINAGGGTYASMTASTKADVADILAYVGTLTSCDLYLGEEVILTIPPGTLEDFYAGAYIQAQMGRNANSRFNTFYESESAIRELTIRGVKFKENKMAFKVQQGKSIPYLTADNVNSTVSTNIGMGYVKSDYANGIYPIINIYNPNHTMQVSKGWGYVFEQDLFNEFSSEAFQWGFGPQITDARLVFTYRWPSTTKTFGSLTPFSGTKRVYYMDELLAGASATITPTVENINSITAIVDIEDANGNPLDPMAFETQIFLYVENKSDSGTDKEQAFKNMTVYMEESGIYNVPQVPAGTYTLTLKRRIMDIAVGAKGTETYIDLATAVDVTVIDGTTPPPPVA